MQIAVDVFLFIVYIVAFIYLCLLTWKFWIMHTSQKYMNALNFKMLEIKIPRDVFKSPEAMEIAANAFLQGGGVGTWYARNWKGAVPTFFSLEIASFEGDVKFFIRCEKKFVPLVTNNMYSQYPGIEISEVEDYVGKIFYEHRSQDVSIWGITLKLAAKFKLPKTKSDREGMKDNDLSMPADFKMLKTYVDYKMDKDPKEEFKHDPLTPVLEWLGSMRKGEYAFYQVIVQDTGKFDGKAFSKTYHNEKTHEEFTLPELAKERLNDIRKTGKKKVIKVGEIIRDEYGYPRMMRNPDFKKNTDGTTNGEPEEIAKTYASDFFTKDELNKGYKEIEQPGVKENELYQEEKDEIEMITRKLKKPLLRAGIRLMYMTDKSKADGGNFGPNIQSTLSVHKQFTGTGYNNFFPSSLTSPYDYEWENSFKRRVPWRGEEFFEGYVEREMFYPHVPERAKAKTWLGKLFFGKGVDWYSDVYLFNFKLTTRKVVRLIYEGIFHTNEHAHPEHVFTINIEELASLWHLPGQVATTPGIKRVDSLKSEYPDNLPR